MRVFYVFQGKTYPIEKNEGVIRSRQKTKNNKIIPSTALMKEVQKGDYILHGYNKNIVAISVVKNSYEKIILPETLNNDQRRKKKDGYQISCEYYEFKNPLDLKNHQNWIIENNTDKINNPFDIKGKGKQRYLCNISENFVKYFIMEIIKLQQNETTLKILLDCLSIYNNQNQSINDILSTIKNVSVSLEEKPEEKNIQLYKNEGKEKQVRNIPTSIQALEKAKYLCEFDPNHKLFMRKNGLHTYTESHHLIPLSKHNEFNKSLDVPANIVSLCSHCHNLLHYGQLQDKKEILSKLYKEREQRLKNCELHIDFSQLLSYYD